MTHVKPSIFVLILSSMIFVINSSAQRLLEVTKGPTFIEVLRFLREPKPCI